MPFWTCEQCGAQFPESAAPPPSCPICEDERQYVNWKGQQWLTREELAQRHKLVWRDDLGIPGIGVDPGFAIGQRALFVREARWLRDVGLHPAGHARGGGACPLARRPEGDCGFASALLWRGRRLERGVRWRADLSAWRRSRQWVTRPHPAIVPWTGDSHRISDDILLVRTGGHFAGGTILHWRAGAEGRGALLTGDVAMVAMDRRSLSFMYSFPNYIPLNAASVRRHRARGRAAGVRSHLRRVVGPQYRGGCKGGV